jgi:protein-disulfide isomerase
VAAGPTVTRLLAMYPNRVRLVVKYLPFRLHEYARIAAEAALAAGDQGMYWKMHDLLISRSPKLDRESLIRYATELGLDLKKFTESIDGKQHARVIERDEELASRMAILSTPTYFINGRKVVGNRPVEYLQKIIDEELQNTK